MRPRCTRSPQALRLPFALVIMALGLAACNGNDPQPVPQNTAPRVIRVAPNADQIVDTVGRTIAMRFSASDAEQLARWRVYTRVGPITTEWKAPEALFGTQKEVAFSFTVPDVPHFTQMDICTEVTDRQGARDTNCVRLTVFNAKQSADDSIAGYPILSYVNDTDTVYHRANPFFGDERNAYNLVVNDYALGGASAQDFRESTQLQGQFNAEFESPNQQAGGNPNPFVVVRPTEFNFEALDYFTMRNAYLGSIQRPTTGRLQKDDIVILQMRLEPDVPGRPHYAAIRIIEVYDSDVFDDEDYISFVYKRSENQED